MTVLTLLTSLLDLQVKKAFFAQVTTYWGLNIGIHILLLFFGQTCEAAKMETRIQRRVLPVLMVPPNLTNNVCPLIAKSECVTSIILSNTTYRAMWFDSIADVAMTFEENTVFVQGVLHWNSLVWKYTGLKRSLICVSLVSEKLNVLSHIRAQ